MPKVNYGPEPKAAPPSLVVLLQQTRALDDPVQMYAHFEMCIDRARVLEGRLNDLHDAVEKAVDHLNERDGQFKYDGKGEHLVEEALAVLNRVL